MFLLYISNFEPHLFLETADIDSAYVQVMLGFLSGLSHSTKLLSYCAVIISKRVWNAI